MIRNRSNGGIVLRCQASRIDPVSLVPAGMLLALAVLLGGCGPARPPATAPRHELNSTTVFGVPLGADVGRLRLEMARADVDFDEVATDLARPARVLVFDGIPDPIMRRGLLCSRFSLASNEAVGLELHYPRGSFAEIRARLQQRWGPGRQRGPSGHSWRGRGATATLRPSVQGGPVRVSVGIAPLAVGPRF